MIDWVKELEALGAPLLAMLAGMLALLCDLGKRSEARGRLITAVGLAALIGGVGISLVNAMPALEPDMGHKLLLADTQPQTYFGGGLVNDPFAASLNIVVCLITALTIGMSGKYLVERRIPQGEFQALVLFSASGAMIMVQSVDLINIFLGLEVLSVALYVLAGIARSDRKSEESAVKYFLLGAFGSGFLLYGIALIYGSTALAAAANHRDLSGYSFTDLYVVSEVLRNTALTSGPLAQSPVFLIGFGLVLVGLGFKAAIVPFHSYAPDVYEGAPAPVTAFLSVAAKVGAFAAIVRVLQPLWVMHHQGNLIRDILWGLAAATMVVGNVLAVRQSNVKRMLAYSSIAHAGYLLVGALATTLAPGAGTAADAIIYYLLAYALMNAGAFAVLLWVGRDAGECSQIQDLHGLGKRNPAAAAAMALCLLSLAGVPPTAGFFGKLYLFLGAFQSGLVGLSVLGLLASVVGVFYYLNLIVAMFFRDSDTEPGVGRAGGARVVALLAAIGTLVLGVCPTGVFSPKTGPIMAEVPPENIPYLREHAARQEAASRANAPTPRPSASPAAAGGAFLTPGETARMGGAGYAAAMMRQRQRQQSGASTAPMAASPVPTATPKPASTPIPQSTPPPARTLAPSAGGQPVQGRR